MMFKKKSKTDYKDLYTRVSADFQNYKRRVEKERAEWMRGAQGDVILPLLSVLDDLERGIEACRTQEETKEQQEVCAGLELVYKNVSKTFNDFEIEEIACSGAFNPELHEALVQVESAEHESGEIVDVITKGYMFHSQVLRHAKVSVAK